MENSLTPTDENLLLCCFKSSDYQEYIYYGLRYISKIKLQYKELSKKPENIQRQIILNISKYKDNRQIDLIASLSMEEVNSLPVADSLDTSSRIIAGTALSIIFLIITALLNGHILHSWPTSFSLLNIVADIIIPLPFLLALIFWFIKYIDNRRNMSCVIRGKKVLRRRQYWRTYTFDDLPILSTSGLSHADFLTCPVCQGQGTISSSYTYTTTTHHSIPHVSGPIGSETSWGQGAYESNSVDRSTETVYHTVTCSSCSGRGKVDKFQAAVEYNNLVLKYNEERKWLFDNFPGISNWLKEINDKIRLWNLKIGYDS